VPSYPECNCTADFIRRPPFQCFAGVAEHARLRVQLQVQTHGCQPGSTCVQPGSTCAEPGSTCAQPGSTCGQSHRTSSWMCAKQMIPPAVHKPLCCRASKCWLLHCSCSAAQGALRTTCAA
jgi:hypothetical protein